MINNKKEYRRALIMLDLNDQIIIANIDMVDKWPQAIKDKHSAKQMELWNEVKEYRARKKKLKWFRRGA